MHAPDFWRRRGPVANVLRPAGWCYAAAGWIRQRLTTPERLTVPVICVGNLVAGGAGKTPTVIALAGLLAEHQPHILLRGYGGSEPGPLRVDSSVHTAAEVGDEALLLARHAPTWVARDRAAGGVAATIAGAGLVLMDDGFQNPGLAKNLSLLVVDATQGIGNGLCLPAGPLREPVARGLNRADAIVLIGEGGLPFAWHGPVFRASVRASGDLAGWHGRTVYAFAGIGRPEKFFATLSALGADIIGQAAFKDHHPYSEQDLERMARALPASARLVTTEKDHARLPPAWRSRIDALPIALHFETPEAVANWLASKLSPTT